MAKTWTDSIFNLFAPKQLKDTIDLDNQTIVIDEENGVRCSARLKDGKLLDLRGMYGVSTMYETFMKGLATSGDLPCLGVRQGDCYNWITYAEVHEQAKNLGSAMYDHMGLSTTKEPIVGIYSSNRPEWIISDISCFMYSMANAPLYDTLGPDACSYIINQTEMEVLVVDTVVRATQLINQAEDLPTLEHIIVILASDSERDELAQKHPKIKIYTWQQVQDIGKKNPSPLKLAVPDSLSTISYTSGTTGPPKGVMIKHKHMLSMMLGLLHEQNSIKDSNLELDNESVHLSYLPLAHMMERTVEHALLFKGAQIGFYSGDIKEILNDVQALKPTAFVTVPRLLLRIYDKVTMGVKSSPVKAKLLEWALSSKIADVRNGIFRRNTIWDILIFGRIQNALGGRVKLVVTGSAPLDQKVLDFFRCALGCPIIEGYGQTECVAGVTITSPLEHRAGHVGVPICCNYIKLADVPEMNLVAKRDGRGEVCVKGDNTTDGYYKMPEKTAELFDSDGWLHTGDIGIWTDFGTLKIVDRCKHIFKLSQGEYIAPEKIEIVLVRCSSIAQIFVDGNSLNSYIVAIVIPDFEVVVPMAEKMGIEDTTPKSLCANKQIKEMILQEIAEEGKSNGFKGFEQVKAVYLCPEMFTPDNGLLTPTLKNKRPALRAHFKSQIDKLYEENSDA